MENEMITPEQAVKIAEWFPLLRPDFAEPYQSKEERKTWYWINGVAQDLRNWLSSPEGEVAMINQPELANTIKEVQRLVTAIPEGKTLIGTCETCKYWDDQNNSDIHIRDGFGMCSDRDEPWYKDDGCISWKEKTE